MFDPISASSYQTGAEHEADASLFVVFSYSARENPKKSETEGRPVFDQVEMVRIVVPGGKDEVIREASDADRQRFAGRYERFKKGDETKVDGTPLEEWPALTVTRIAELKALNIYSVDQLAGVSDNVIPKLGLGGRELVERAKARLAAAQDGAEVERLAAENTRLREREARLTTENQQLKDQILLLQEKSHG